MIDPNRHYRTRDGRAVRIYAIDGADPFPVHGAVLCPDNDMGDGGEWLQFSWRPDGGMRHPRAPDDDGHPSDLIEVTLADEIRDQIPWSALRPEIRWVALSSSGKWIGYENGNEPRMGHFVFVNGGGYLIGEAVAMPEADPDRWRETLVERPDDFAEAM